MKNVKVSIAMATYNGEKYLREQLDSILAQTISDWELIISDDCSTDSTVEILNEYAMRDARIKVFVNEKNIGFKKNFEKAILFCFGKFIALSDQDDIWHENHLEILLNLLGNASMSSANTNIIDEFGNITQGASYSERHCYEKDGCTEDKLYRILFNSSPCQGASSLYKKELFQFALPVPEKVKFHDAWFSACACCLNGINYSFLPITDYRLHGNNASGNHFHITFSSRIEKFFSNPKRQTSDRKVYCEELLKRYPNSSKSIQNIIKKAYTFYENIENNNSWKNVFCLIAHYKQIYAVKSYKLLPFRIMTMILRKSGEKN